MQTAGMSHADEVHVDAMSHADEVHVDAIRCIDSISIHMQRAKEHLEKVLAGIEAREGRTSRLGAKRRRARRSTGRPSHLIKETGDLREFVMGLQ
jgi:hypothetical protein